MAAYYATSSPEDIWYSWADCPATNCTANTSGVWYRWCNTTATTATTSDGWMAEETSTTALVWTRWNGTATLAASNMAYRPTAGPTAEELEQRAKAAEEQAERERLRRIEAEKEAAAAREAEKRADQRAKKLLLQCLTLEQKRDYARNKRFRVRSPSGTLYELRHGWAGNVEELNAENKPVRRFCIHPDRTVPVADNLLAQKLLIECDEGRFRKTANVTELCRN